MEFGPAILVADDRAAEMARAIDERGVAFADFHGEGIEPGLNYGFKRLQGLGVVVFHHRDRKVRQGLHQGARQQVGHVVVPRAAKHPLAPVFELAANLGVIHVEITTH